MDQRDRLVDSLIELVKVAAQPANLIGRSCDRAKLVLVPSVQKKLPSLLDGPSDCSGRKAAEEIESDRVGIEPGPFWCRWILHRDVTSAQRSGSAVAASNESRRSAGA